MKKTILQMIIRVPKSYKTNLQNRDKKEMVKCRIDLLKIKIQSNKRTPRTMMVTQARNKKR